MAVIEHVPQTLPQVGTQMDLQDLQSLGFDMLQHLVDSHIPRKQRAELPFPGVSSQLVPKKTAIK